ncbi:MAG TPA: CheR family methyltransferase [Candidatus Brocadiaceae bacterium]
MITNHVLSKTDFDKFRQFIENRSGVYIDDSKQTSFKMNLDTRMHALGILDYDAYYSFIINNDAGRKEFEELLDLLLIKETFFFRDERQLKTLLHHVLPELSERKRSQEIRIWSAGCATGEEPYSIAMAIKENFFPEGMNVSIFGTDISNTALKMAKEGIYTKSSMRAIDTWLLNKYFTKKDGRYYLCDQVKQRVRFDLLNLVEPYFLFEKNSIDIVFCKNVIIYFRLETVQTIIRRLCDMLAEGGYLFLGHSESLWQISDDFKLEEVGGVFFYRKNGRGAAMPLFDKSRQKEELPEDITRKRFPGTKAAPLQKRQKIDMDSVPVSRERRENVLTRGSERNKKKDIPKWLTERIQLSGDDIDGKLDEIEGVLNEEPGNVDAHLLAGRIYADMGLYDKALKKGMDILKIDDFSGEAYALMGSIYYKIGDKENAVTAFKKAIYLDEKSVLSHYYLGNLYKDSHLINQAVKEYRNVIQIIDMHAGNGLLPIGEVFTGKQLKEICSRNIEMLAVNKIP